MAMLYMLENKVSLNEINNFLKNVDKHTSDWAVAELKELSEKVRAYRIKMEGDLKKINGKPNE